MARSKSTVKPIKAKVITKHAKKQLESLKDAIPNELSSKQHEFFSAHTIPEMLSIASRNSDVEIEASVMGKTEEGFKQIKFTDKKKFFEALKKNETEPKRKKFLEDAFNTDGNAGSNGGSYLVGEEIVPLLGGPFSKQLYYQDYIRMHMQAFYAYHNDPVAFRAVSIIKDFTLGRGWSVEVKSDDDRTKATATALWDTFKVVNRLDTLLNYMSIEMSIYGEIMLWKLPGNQTKVAYQVPKDQMPSTGLFPRYRLVDPSSCWDIITYPEDITRVLAYQLVFPTQYQIYTHDNKTGINVPSLKFIYNQVPGYQINHYKVNCVSNEKRGRSDLFPIMNYLKRLRDTINYSVIAMQKAAAWSIDTTIDGSQEDIDGYVTSQEELGSIPPAGSEFVHTKAVERKYLNNAGSSGKDSESFEWLLSMSAMGVGIPVSWFGTHIVASSSRASAETSVQPVFKMIETRRELMKEILTNMFDDLMKQFGVKATCDVIFPEIMVEDRSKKLADLELSENAKWVDHETAANIAAKELGVKDYDFEQTMAKIASQPPSELPTSMPLTTPGTSGAGAGGQNLPVQPDPDSDQT